MIKAIKMMYLAFLLMLYVTQTLSQDELIPNIIVERDGYTVGHQTFQYDMSSSHGRYARDTKEYRTDFSQKEIDEIVDYHNSLRTQVQPPASNMEYMVRNLYIHVSMDLFEVHTLS